MVNSNKHHSSSQIFIAWINTHQGGNDAIGIHNIILLVIQVIPIIIFLCWSWTTTCWGLARKAIVLHVMVNTVWHWLYGDYHRTWLKGTTDWKTSLVMDWFNFIKNFLLHKSSLVFASTTYSDNNTKNS